VYFRRVGAGGLYTDPDRKRWGSATVVTKELGTPALRQDPGFKNLLTTLPTQKVLSGKRTPDAYNIEVVKDAILSHPELSVYLRRVGEDGFYTDLEQRKWGSIRSIAKELGVTSLRKNEEFKKLLTTLPTQKVLSGVKTPDAYDIEVVKRAMLKSPTLSKYLQH
jgi:hypothetical protein